MTDMCSWPGCGENLPENLKLIAFPLPDELLAAPSGPLPGDPLTISRIDAGDAGFVRALMPVPVGGGYELSFNLWLRVEGEDLARVRARWGDDRLYRGLVLFGTLGNALPLWGLAGAPVLVATPEDARSLPGVVASPDPRIERLLTTVWPPELVLPALPSWHVPSESDP